jgi:hypothetical protein
MWTDLFGRLAGNRTEEDLCQAVLKLFAATLRFTS